MATTYRLCHRAATRFYEGCSFACKGFPRSRQKIVADVQSQIDNGWSLNCER